MIRLFTKLSGAALIIEEADNGFYLFTHKKGGSSSDTWHQTLEDAKCQADHEWRGMRINWHDVPDSVSDLHAFGRANLS